MKERERKEKKDGKKKNIYIHVYIYKSLLLVKEQQHINTLDGNQISSPAMRYACINI